MQLKLAEYKEVKFKKFLELGRDFGYFGQFITVGNGRWSLLENELIEPEDCQVPEYSTTIYRYKKDEKDPLNRFEGLFDGRTYGDGKFVLIEVDQDNVIREDFGSKDYYVVGFNVMSELVPCLDLIGNLHENPELWEKVK
jgi:hypothetical protein